MDKVKLGQLRMLVAAVDAGGFSAASAELGCTQSRVSQAISELERHIGVRLLRRSRSGCVPTEEGWQVVERAREILSLTSGLLDVASQDGSKTGAVRVACVRSIGTHLLPHAVEQLSQSFPGIHLEVQDGCMDSAEVTALVERGDAELGIARGPINPQLEAYPYISDPYVVIAPDTIRLKSPVCWSELSQLPFIHLRQPCASWIIEQCWASGCLQVPTRRLVNESGIVAMVSRGLGYTVLPRLMAYPPVAGTQVVSLPFRAARHLSLIATPSAASTDIAKTAMQVILNKSIVMKTDAWRDGVICIDNNAVLAQVPAAVVRQ